MFSSRDNDWIEVVDTATGKVTAKIDTTNDCPPFAGNHSRIIGVAVASAGDVWVQCQVDDPVDVMPHGHPFGTTDHGATWFPLMGAP